MSCGIYCIKNKVNGKRYVGKSIDIERRWNNHITQLRNNNHPNEYLQRSWNKYGEDVFDFCVLEVCESETLNSREIYWIDYYESFTNGYNLTLGGDGGNTIAGYTEEQLKKLKQKHQSISINKGENNPMSKLSESDVYKIIQKLLNGEYIVDIAREYNVDSVTIRDIKSHRTWTDITKDITFPSVSKKAVKGIHGKRVNQYTLDGVLINSFVSAAEAERITGCARQNISAVCNGTKHTCMGYVWKFADESILLN